MDLHIYISTAKKKLRCPNKETAADRTVSVPSKPICQRCQDVPDQGRDFTLWHHWAWGPGVNPKMVGIPQQTMGGFPTKNETFWGCEMGGYHHLRKYLFGYVLSTFLIFLNHECCRTSWAPSIDHLVRSRPRHRPATSKIPLFVGDQFWFIAEEERYQKISDLVGLWESPRKWIVFFKLSSCFKPVSDIEISTTPWHNHYSKPKTLQISKS